MKVLETLKISLLVNEKLAELLIEEYLSVR